MSVFSEFTVSRNNVRVVLQPIKVVFSSHQNMYVASPGIYFKVWVRVEEVSMIGDRTVENSRNQNWCYLAHATFWDQFQNAVSPKIFYFPLDRVSFPSPSRYREQTIN